jgi:EAL domain-containing protein (putative c-di-GMP-specific phosphodiesterase class I)
MSVVAEGVETEVDALLMTQLGCKEMQGYYFSRPANARQIEQTIARLNGTGALAAPPLSGAVTRLYGA